MFTIRHYQQCDFYRILALWKECDLVRPWNDPQTDIDRIVGTAAAALFVADDEKPVQASIMVGSDGHRGWMYYIATTTDRRRQGYATAMIRHAESWLLQQGIDKSMLMIRLENQALQAFYEHLGYAVEARILMTKRLHNP